MPPPDRLLLGRTSSADELPPIPLPDLRSSTMSKLSSQKRHSGVTVSRSSDNSDEAGSQGLLKSKSACRSLPKELLSLIASHCDVPTHVALAQTCRFFSEIAEYGLFQSLDITLSPQYGEQPLILPFAREDSDRWRTWAIAQARAGEAARRAALKEKIMMIINRANERKWRMVQRVRMEPRQGSVFLLLALLEFVSPTVQVLELSEPVHHPWDHEWAPKCTELLEVRMIDSGISFPSLTHLDLAKSSIRRYEAVSVLLGAAPNLESLAVDLSGRHTVLVGHRQIPFPSIETPKIHKLRLSLGDMDGADSDEVIDYLCMLLDRSSLLEELSLDFHGVEPPHHLLDELLSHLRDRPLFQSLHWSISPDAMTTYLRRSPRAFRTLKRLVIQAENPMEMLQDLDLSRLPSLQTLWFAIPSRPDDGVIGWTRTVFPPPATLRFSLSLLAQKVRRCPQLRFLRYIHRVSPDVFSIIDKLNPTANTLGEFTSYRHNQNEIIHLRLFMESHERAAPDYQSASRTLFEYVPRPLVGGGTVFEKRALAGWGDVAEFMGVQVPLHMLEWMRQGQGTPAERWTGKRGIYVIFPMWDRLEQWWYAQRKERKCRF